MKTSEPKQPGPAKLGKAQPKTWEKQETRLAKRSDGKRTRGSGSGNDKGDVKGAKTSLVKSELRIEAKSTKHASMSVKRSWLTKITEEARATGQTPALAITFAESDPGVDPDWIMLPASAVFGEQI
jgi:Holliday junction resolvase